MEHIFRDERGVVHFDLYFTYVESVKERFHHASLHDAWLDYLHIVDPAEGERRELRKIEL